MDRLEEIEAHYRGSMERFGYPVVSHEVMEWLIEEVKRLRERLEAAVAELAAHQEEVVRLRLTLNDIARVNSDAHIGSPSAHRQIHQLINRAIMVDQRTPESEVQQRPAD